MLNFSEKVTHDDGLEPALSCNVVCIIQIFTFKCQTIKTARKLGEKSHSPGTEFCFLGHNLRTRLWLSDRGLLPMHESLGSIPSTMGKKVSFLFLFSLKYYNMIGPFYIYLMLKSRKYTRDIYIVIYKIKKCNILQLSEILYLYYKN